MLSLLGVLAGAQTAHEPGWTVSTFASGLTNPANGLEFDCATNGFFTAEFGASQVSSVDSLGNVSFFASVPSVDEIALDRASTFLFAKEHSSGPVHMFDTLGTALGTIGGFGSPTGTAFDSSGNFYVADQGTLEIYRYDATTLPPNVPVQTLFASGFESLEGMRFDCQDNLFATEFVAGNVVQVVPPAGPHITWVSGQATPINVAFDPCTGDLFVSNLGVGTILRVTSPGVFTTFGSGLDNPFALVFDRAGNLYVNEFNGNRIVEFTTPSPCDENCLCPIGVNNPPVFEEPTCDEMLFVDIGTPLSYTVTASDPDALDVVTLSVGGAPAGSTHTPDLPLMGNPVSTTFDWTPGPGDVGTYIVSYNAADGQAVTGCAVIIEVPPACEEAAAATPLGAGCGATLSATPPVLGLSCTVTLDGNTPGGLAFFNLSRPGPGGLFYEGCEIFLKPGAFYRLAVIATDANGDASFTGTIPFNLVKCGVDFTLQAVVIGDDGPTSIGEITNGVALTFGS